MLRIQVTGAGSAAILGASLVVPAPALAQPPQQIVPHAIRPGLDAIDARHPVDIADAPWRSLVRVQTELGGRCTGTLIAPNRVATAAHCLYIRRTGNPVQPRSVHVLLGYDRGRYTAHARVLAYRMGEGYHAAGGWPPGADWAVLTLDAPIGADRVLPILRTPTPPNTQAMLGGWQQDRPESILADTECRILGVTTPPGGRMLVHTCAATRGASGGPLLARDANGAWALAGIASVVTLHAARGAAVAAASLVAPD